MGDDDRDSILIYESSLFAPGVVLAREARGSMVNDEDGVIELGDVSGGLRTS